MSELKTLNQMFPKQRQQKMYTLKACQDLIGRYAERDGEIVTLEEGCLGLGLVLCQAENCKVTIIREVYINCWTSGHTIRMYNKMPKKYEKMLEDYYNKED